MNRVETDLPIKETVSNRKVLEVSLKNFIFINSTNKINGKKLIKPVEVKSSTSLQIIVL